MNPRFLGSPREDKNQVSVLVVNNKQLKGCGKLAADNDVGCKN